MYWRALLLFLGVISEMQFMIIQVMALLRPDPVPDFSRHGMGCSSLRAISSANCALLGFATDSHTLLPISSTAFFLFPFAPTMLQSIRR